MSAHRENPAKIYVSVRADHLLNGRIRPLMFRAKDGPVVRIDRILDEREARPSRLAGRACAIPAASAKNSSISFTMTFTGSLKPNNRTPSPFPEYDTVSR